MSLYAKPSYTSPVFNSARFSTTKAPKGKRQTLQTFSAGIRTPFIEFTGDNSMQLSAQENPIITYLDNTNVQLSTQPFRQNNYVVKAGCESIYLPKSEPIDGYTIQIFNSQPLPIRLESEKFPMYNTFYLPKGGNTIVFLPQQMTILKFFQKTWTILIF